MDDLKTSMMKTSIDIMGIYIHKRGIWEIGREAGMGNLFYRVQLYYI